MAEAILLDGFFPQIVGMLEGELVRAETAADVEIYFRPLKALLGTVDAEEIANERTDMIVDAVIEV